MTLQAIMKLAVVNLGKIAATRKEMFLFSFETPEGAVRFANCTGGMLIRGMERGAVHVGVIPPEST